MKPKPMIPIADCEQGFLYDMLIFTGDSPINTPYLGLYRFIPGMKDRDWEHEKHEDSAV